MYHNPEQAEFLAPREGPQVLSSHSRMSSRTPMEKKGADNTSSSLN